MDRTALLGLVLKDEDKLRKAISSLGAKAVLRSDMWIIGRSDGHPDGVADDEGVRSMDADWQAQIFDWGMARSDVNWAAQQIDDRGSWLLVVRHSTAAVHDVISVARALDAQLLPSTAAVQDNDRTVSVPLLREELSIGKYVAKAGEVTVHKEVITQMHRFEVPVVREELVIQRFPLGAEPSLERIVLSEEQVRITKRTVTREVVDVRRVRSYHTEHVERPLRREVIRLETTGDVKIHGADEV